MLCVPSPSLFPIFLQSSITQKLLYEKVSIDGFPVYRLGIDQYGARKIKKN
jgi:hypothetical protein